VRDEDGAGLSKYYQHLIDNTLDMITVLDVEGRVVFNSPAVKTCLGYEPDELNGRFVFDLVHPDDRKTLVDAYGSGVRIPGAVEYYEYRFLHKDGSWHYVESTGTNLLDDLAVSGVLVTSRDITDRRHMEQELRESEELYRTLVSTSPDGITVTDLQAEILFVSPQLVEMHAFKDADELLGTSALDLIAPDDKERAIAELAQMVRSGHARNVELTLLRKDGSRFRAELNAALIRDAAGEPWRMVAYTRDISERKSMIAELRERNEELEAFAHTISHDLLSPVAVVEGYAKAALEADAEGRSEAERECLEAIARGARRMSDLINSLLQYAQAGHMDLNTCDVDPEEILLEVLMDLEEAAQEKNARIESAADMPRVEVNAVKLRQVFNNLISNALKHMGDNPDPEVVISAAVHGSSATFCVRDNGLGIPSELHEKVFEPFRHFSLAGSQGLGIGLSTVKRAVKVWGGKVWVESTPGGGAAFFFTAPLAG
jgi:PAS domain S-box-containing protein